MAPDPKASNKETRESRNGRSPNWRDLARSTANEQDPARVLERAQELIRALDAESQEHMGHLPAEKNSHKVAS